MAVNSDVKDLRDAIGRELSARLAVERENPEQLIGLLRRLRRDEESSNARIVDGIPHVDSVERAIAGTEPPAIASPRTIRRELNLYFDAIGKYLPDWFCRMAIRLRRPSRWPLRIAASLLLVT